ncbi:MAG: hypothetical protein RL758_830 [Pseudomonadota bacterium]|jgi:Photosynthesis system II assembly factor YCF48
MKRNQARRQWLCRAALLVPMVLAACTQAPDMKAVEAERSKPVARVDLFQAVASNGKVIVGASGAGAMVVSADNGASWKRQPLAQPTSVIGISPCPDGGFVAVDFYKKVWFGDATATKWTSSALKSSVNPLSVTCDPAGRVWVVGSHLSIQSSADKGGSWNAVELGGDAMLGTVQFIDANFGIATGEFGTVATTNDGGKTWSKSKIAQKDFYPYSATFINRNQGWMSGVAGVVLGTKDSGRTWSEVPNQSGGPIYALTQLGEKVYGVGAGGVLSELQDGQFKRLPYDKPAPAFLTSVAPVGDKQLAIAGAAGALQLVTPSSDKKTQ